MKRLLWLLGLATLGAIPFAAFAQTAAPYPAKPIRMVIPWPPGGPTDMVGRPVARRLEQALGQPVVIDNRGGAGGTIGAESVAKSAPDGYTLLVGGLSTHGIGPSIYPKLGYDAVKDFAPITLMAMVQNVLVVHPSMPAKHLKDLLALARKSPGKLNYASVGVGSTSHLMTEMINSMAGVKTVHVPYKGGAPALTAVLGGEVDFYLGGLPALLGHVKSGRLRALAVTAERRSPHTPEIPTMIESGMAGYNVSSWYVLLSSAGTPREIVMRLNEILVKGLKSPEMMESLNNMGAEPMGTTPEQTTEFIRRELAVWAKAVRDSGAKFD